MADDPLSEIRNSLSESGHLQPEQYEALIRQAKQREARREGRNEKQSAYDVFVSYAGEDRPLAGAVASSLRRIGFNVWYDQFELKVGDRVLKKINEGLSGSGHGILIVSKDFIAKNWPNYETDIMVRDLIEDRKVLLPVWHEISAEEVRAFHPVLADVFALNTGQGLPTVINKLAQALAPGSSAIAAVPSYSSPIFRFFQGDGELTLGVDGPAFTIWEALVSKRTDLFPLLVGGRLYEREDFLCEVYDRMSSMRDVARGYISQEDFDAIWEECEALGLDPGVF